MNTTLYHAIARIAGALNAVQARWAIGGSVLLAHHGLVDQPNDLDILVDPADISPVDRVLKGLGEKKRWEKDAVYATEHFYEYCIAGTDVDIISGFRINTASGQYHYRFDEHSIVETVVIEGQAVYLSSLEDWYVLYQLIPGREAKVGLIESHLLKTGVMNRNLLQRALQKNVPEEVNTRTLALLRSAE